MREQIDAAVRRALEPDERALAKLRGQHKLTARERIDAAGRAGSFVEDGLLANNQSALTGGDELPADGVVTGHAPSTVCRRSSWPTTRW